MKKFKKIVTSLLLSVAIVISAGGMSANAAIETRSWTAKDINDGGGYYGDVTGFAYLVASGDTYTGTVTSMSNITNRKLTLSSTTHTMTTGPIVYNNTGSRKWKIEGQVGTVRYEMVAYTSLKENLVVSGTVSRN